MPNLLVTPTLLNAYEFAANAPPSWKARAYKSFIQKLRREKTPFSDAAKKGVAFEDTVYRVCKKVMSNPGKHDIKDSGSTYFQSIALHCYGGEFQKVFKKTLIIDDEEFLIYTKMDVVFPSTIIDLKTTLNYKGSYKYLSGWQHKIYTWVSDIPNFKYIIAEWLNSYDTTIKDVHYVEYTAKDFIDAEVDLVKGIRELLSYIHKNSLYEDYFFTFSNNRR